MTRNKTANPIVSATAFDRAMRALAKKDDAVFLQRFFKTGEGQYGAGDVFIGVRAPGIRKLCARAKSMPLPEVKTLLKNPVHEYRLAAVILLSGRYKTESEQEEVYQIYLDALNDGRIDSWDIVDSSAEHVIGAYLEKRPRDVLFALAQHNDIWHRRVAILATYRFIKDGDASTTLQLAEALLHDPHDLIHKAVGWMLREVGKRVDRKLLVQFLEEYAGEMPRTMLRYAIEHFSLQERMRFMRARLKA